MTVALVVFGLAFVVFVYFAIACEVAYSLACRERTDRDRWVSGVRLLTAEQKADVLAQIERARPVIVPGLHTPVRISPDAISQLRQRQLEELIVTNRVLLSVSPASGPGGDRPTPTGQVTPNHNGDAA